MGLLSKDHRNALRDAKRTVNRVAVADIARSVDALEAAHRVAPALGLVWPPPRQWVAREGDTPARWTLDICAAAIRAV